MLSDGTLLRHYVDTHDGSAFTELVGRHLDGVYSSALRRLGGDRQLAEDVAQKVFIELVRQAPRLCDHPFLTAWLYTTTRNQAANVVRAEQRRKAREKAAGDMNKLSAEPSSEIDWDRVSPVLDWAIDQLGDAERAVVLLRFVSQKSFLEMGSALRISEDAARMRLERALDKLRRILARRGIISTAVLLSAGLAQHTVMAAPTHLCPGIAAGALASGSTAGPLLTYLYMTTPKWAALIAAGVLSAVTLGGTLPALRAKRTAEASLDVSVREYEATLAKIAEQERHLQQSATALAEREKKAAELEVARREEAAVQARASLRRDSKAEGAAFLARHPEVKQAFSDYQRGEIMFHYGQLFQQLRLNPAQIDEFVSLAAEFSSFGRGLAQNGGDYVELSLGSGKSGNEVYRQLHELLGDHGFDLYTQLTREQPARELVTQTASALVFDENPLTSTQADQLIGLITKNSRAAGKGEPASINWDVVVNEAQLILSPDQLATFSGMRAQDEYRQALTRAHRKPAVQRAANMTRN